MLTVTEQSWMLLTLYSLLQKAVLPEPGGWFQQTSMYADAMREITILEADRDGRKS